MRCIQSREIFLVGDHTDVSLTCAGGANPGIVNALKGTVTINPVSGSGSIVVTSRMLLRLLFSKEYRTC